jgi:sugar phosphate isomerase/epimerase
MKWIEQLGPQIGYVHLHNNDGEHDQHQALNDGTVPMLEVCHALRQYAPSAVWAIEAVGEGMRQSLDWLNSNGFLGR